MKQRTRNTVICLLAGAGSIVSNAACHADWNTKGAAKKEIFNRAATQDARNAPKALHLAYLNCYALPDSKKKDCKRKARHAYNHLMRAFNRDYILTFDYEAERLGFAAFLNDKGKSCKRIDEGPRYEKIQDTYIVKCVSGEEYPMRFDWKEEKWQLVG